MTLRDLRLRARPAEEFDADGSPSCAWLWDRRGVERWVVTVPFVDSGRVVVALDAVGDGTQEQVLAAAMSLAPAVVEMLGGLLNEGSIELDDADVEVPRAPATT